MFDIMDDGEREYYTTPRLATRGDQSEDWGNAPARKEVFCLYPRMSCGVRTRHTPFRLAVNPAAPPTTKSLLLHDRMNNILHSEPTAPRNPIAQLPMKSWHSSHQQRISGAIEPQCDRPETNHSSASRHGRII